VAVCDKCGIAYTYAGGHVCQGRDKTKVWLLTSVAAGAVGGGLLGRIYGNRVLAQVCDAPDAGNLCGLFSAPTVPLYVGIGAVVGAFVGALVLVIVLRRRRL
jgi:hypothetical protein